MPTHEAGGKYLPLFTDAKVNINLFLYIPIQWIASPNCKGPFIPEKSSHKIENSAGR